MLARLTKVLLLCSVTLFSSLQIIQAKSAEMGIMPRFAGMGFAGSGAPRISSNSNPIRDANAWLETGRTELFGVGYFYEYYNIGARFAEKWRMGINIEKTTDRDIIDNSGWSQSFFTFDITRELKDKLNMGFNIGYESCLLSGEKIGEGKSMDLSLLFGPWPIKNSLFKIGLQVNNITASRQFNKGRTEQPDIENELRFNLSNDDWNFAVDYRNNQIYTGFEYLASEAIRLRIGLANRQPTFGVGIKHNKFAIDYAYWLSDLGIGASNILGVSLVY